MKKKFCEFQVAKINFLVTFKSRLKKIDDFQSSKLKFLVTFNTQNKIFIVEFFGYLGQEVRNTILKNFGSLSMIGNMVFAIHLIHIRTESILFLMIIGWLWHKKYTCQWILPLM